MKPTPDLSHIDQNLTPKHPLGSKKTNPVEVKEAMLKVNTNKAMSYDNIPPRAIKESAKILCYPFSILFNHILENSRIPQQWRLGEVSLVNKKDCCLTKSNYRPLSILPSLSKIFKTHIHSRISHYFEDIFHDHIFTYRKNHRTDTALLSLRTVEEET